MPCISPTTRTFPNWVTGCRSKSAPFTATASCGRTSRLGVPTHASRFLHSDALNAAHTTWTAPSTAGDVVLVLNRTAIFQLPLLLIAIAIATLTGQPASLVSLQPRSDTNRNRAQQARSGRAESSGPAVVKGQATKLLHKANNAGLVLEDTMSENAFTAYNHARFGIAISSMEMVAKIAHMKSPIQEGQGR